LGSFVQADAPPQEQGCPAATGGATAWCAPPTPIRSAMFATALERCAARARKRLAPEEATKKAIAP